MDPEWRLYGRSTGDDKGPLIALLTVLDAFEEKGIEPTSNLKFFFDGEEEQSSPHLREFLEKYSEKVADVDLWLFRDGPQHQSRRPQILFGARGVTGLEVTLYGANRPLHSGHYGNWAPVPGAMLASLVASMKDENGRVLILPMAHHDNNQHAANENLRLGNLWYGIDAFAAVMTMGSE